MQLRNARRHECRPSSGPATDVDTDATVRRQQMPRENAEIIIEYLPALLRRQVILVLPECRPFVAESARNPRVEVIVCANWHVQARWPSSRATAARVTTASHAVA